jgi:hypothetical protein
VNRQFDNYVVSMNKENKDHEASTGDWRGVTVYGGGVGAGGGQGASRAPGSRYPDRARANAIEL